MSNSLEKSLKRRPVVDDEFFELYQKLTLMPPDFNKKDPERIRLFSTRLKESREAVAAKNAQIQYHNGHAIAGPRYCNITTQEQVAEWLGISPARVSQYESGRIKEIPCHHLIAFYDMFNVTPHYLLGYTDSPDHALAVLRVPYLVDDNGNFTKLTVRIEKLPFDAHGKCLAKIEYKYELQTDENGRYKTVDFPMTHPVLSQKKAINILSILAWRKIDWFITLSRFLRADDQTLDTGFKILKVLLEASKLTGTEQD